MLLIFAEISSIFHHSHIQIFITQRWHNLHIRMLTSHRSYVPSWNMSYVVTLCSVGLPHAIVATAVVLTGNWLWLRRTFLVETKRLEAPVFFFTLSSRLFKAWKKSRSSQWLPADLHKMPTLKNQWCLASLFKGHFLKRSFCVCNGRKQIMQVSPSLLYDQAFCVFQYMTTQNKSSRNEKPYGQLNSF